MSGTDALQRVLGAMRAARDKHGDAYMGNLTKDYSFPVTLESALVAGQHARIDCDKLGKDCGRFAVLMEEVGEVAEAVHDGNADAVQHELEHVAAMALAWLGVDPDVVDLGIAYLERTDRLVLESSVPLRLEEMEGIGRAVESWRTGQEPVLVLGYGLRLVGVEKQPEVALAPAVLEEVRP